LVRRKADDGRCFSKEILKKLENDEAVVKLFDDIVSQLKIGELLSIK